MNTFSFTRNSFCAIGKYALSQSWENYMPKEYGLIVEGAGVDE
jgi:hypothetical protein